MSLAPHRRFNPLTGEWVFVSPQRAERPWQGALEVPAAYSVAATGAGSGDPSYDPQCYLCPGNLRANGERNPEYKSTHVFTNDFPAFLPDAQASDTPVPSAATDDSLFRSHTQTGTCRVLCFSPRHDLTLAQLSVSETRAVVELWIEQLQELSPRWRWVQIFENKGAVMGASNPHPHGQIWSSDFIPTQIEKEWTRQQAYRQQFGEPLLLRYARLESHYRDRIILENDHWSVVIPWWALWPYETLILPRREVRTLPQLTAPERDSLASCLKTLLSGYDRLFSTPFPYSLGWHGAPRDASADSGWQLHAHIYPPLLRSATVKKHMVGYEMFAEGQRDLTAEEAATRLRQACEPGPIAVTPTSLRP